MSHYDHIGAVYHPALGEVFVPSTATFSDVRAGTAVIARPAKGDNVAQLQAMLNALKFRDFQGKPLAVDKLFGERTQSAVRAAQTAIRAKVPATVMLDGTLDKPTLLALDALKAGQPLPGEVAPAPVTVPPLSPKLPQQQPWWKNPIFIGGALLSVVAVAVLASGDEKKKA